MSGSHEDTKARRRDKEELPKIIVDCAFHLPPPLNLALELLINLGSTTFKTGCNRIVNGPQEFKNTSLSVNQ